VSIYRRRPATVWPLFVVQFVMATSVPADPSKIPTQAPLSRFWRRRGARPQTIEGFEVQGEQFVSYQGSIAHGRFLLL
jgi:hypothetical protein